MTVTVDRRQQIYTVDLSGGGAKFDIDAIWDVSLFAGNDFNFFETPIQDRGRSISLQYDQSSLNTDCEIFGYSVRYHDAETVPLEAS